MVINMFKTNIAVFILVAYISLLVKGSGVTDSGIKTDQLENGCDITRWFGNGTRPQNSWHKMPLPHVDCSRTGLTRFEITGIIQDAKSITLSYNNMIEFHVEDLREMARLQKINLDSNKLQRILPATNLTFLEVYSLSLANNRLEEIPNKALKSFPNLKRLQLFNNAITTISSEDFKFNSALVSLALGPNPITDFNDEWMSEMSIAGITLRGSGLTKIPSKLAGMKDLRYADFADNAVTEIPANSFINCSALVWLDLASNHITTIHDDAFKGAANLKSLDLSDNRLVSLSPRVFDPIANESLQIDMYDNLFNCDCSMSGFKQWYEDMKNLDISTEIRFKCFQPLRNHGKPFNQLPIADISCEESDVSWTECIPPTTFGPPVSTVTPAPTNRQPRTCPNLCNCYDENGEIYFPIPDHKPNKQFNERVYWIRYTNPRVECVDSNYASLPENIPDDVSTLIMTGNRLTKLDIRQLGKFQNLKTLVLKRDNITIIQPSPPTSLPKLKMLILSFNKIKTITKDHLKSFPNLMVFALRHNSVTRIPMDLFSVNRKLERLYLGPNPVTAFEEDFMKTLSVKSLSLRNMSLKAIPKTVRNLVNLTYADFSDNSITTVPNGTFSKCTNLWRVDLENNNISKIEANAFNGATSLYSVDLSENLLQSLPPNVFSNISQDKLKIDLWENPFVCNCSMKDFKAWIEKTENINPSIDIRFRCHNPLRVHDKTSNELSFAQFTCSDDDTIYISHESICPTPNVGGKIALSIILTFLCTVVLCVVAWRCTFKRRYGDLLSYAKQRTDYADMEELQ